ncbi:conserved hypothetical protein [Carnobacterium maltaromaticum]|uniref:hypothetical protein n=1 Tax=Carnobacterium maltaromaticum TaxID=2751 RepID=UPI00191B9C56|nr:hypothetical protein [Carnobacterium maltaromaticum]CAD5902156.1 conserved hypothetical protein [Carnobacterium maltaromaticum]
MQSSNKAQLEQKMIYDVRFIAERKVSLNIKEEVEIHKTLILPSELSHEKLKQIIKTRFINVKSVSCINDFGKGIYLEE